MKPHHTQSNRIFQDRPLPETPHRTRRYASLDRSGFDQTDFADSALRVFLVLSLVVSLVMGGWRLSAVPDSNGQPVETPTAFVPAGSHPSLDTLVRGVSSAVGCVR